MDEGFEENVATKLNYGFYSIHACGSPVVELLIELRGCSVLFEFDFEFCWGFTIFFAFCFLFLFLCRWPVIAKRTT